MNKQNKIVVIWLFIAIGLLMHTALELAEYIFFTTPENEGTADQVPVEVHVIYILAMILPMIMSFLTAFFSGKGFIWFSFIYAILLFILNTFHAVETIIGSISNFSQVVLLVFVAVANGFLVSVLNKWRKGS